MTYKEDAHEEPCVNGLYERDTRQILDYVAELEGESLNGNQFGASIAHIIIFSLLLPIKEDTPSVMRAGRARESISRGTPYETPVALSATPNFPTPGSHTYPEGDPRNKYRQVRGQVHLKYVVAVKALELEGDLQLNLPLHVVC